MAEAKKIVKTKNQFFHARQPREAIFEIHSLQSCNFLTNIPRDSNGHQSSIPGVEIFS